MSRKITNVVHFKKPKLVPSYSCYMPYISKASSVFFDCHDFFLNKKSINSITYGLQGTPISKCLEEIVSYIENGKYTILCPSGLAGIFLVYFSFLRINSCILIPKNIYDPNLRILNYIKSIYGIRILKYNCSDNFKSFVDKYNKYKIDIIFVESPGSITLEIPFLNDIVKFAKYKNSLLFIDSTYFPGYFFNSFSYGFNIVVQALTKYYSGSNDILMGALVFRSYKLYRKVYDCYLNVGFGVQNEDCYLIVRSVSTMFLRYLVHSKSALNIVKWLNNNKMVKKIFHPGFGSASSVKNFSLYYNISGGLFSLIFKKKIFYKKIVEFVSNLRLFKVGYSWGGVVSLVMIYKNYLHDPFMKKYKQYPIVRFYIGLEHWKDLRNDIKHALLILETVI